MNGTGGDDLVFGRYTREECGLPPRGKERWRSAITLRRTLGVVALTACAAWIGGTAMARWRESWVAKLPGRVAAASVQDVPALLEQGRVFAAALPENQRMRRDLALAAVTAGERMPRRLGYYGTATGLFRGLSLPETAGGAERFFTELAAAGTFAEVKEYHDAFLALDRAEKALNDIPDPDRRSYRLLLINAQAYFLASADERDGGDPAKAAELAQLATSSRDPLPDGGFASGSAAFLDTLSVALGRNGDRDGAAAAQKLALGLAAGQDLDVYLQHYDECHGKDVIPRGIHPE